MDSGKKSRMRFLFCADWPRRGLSVGAVAEATGVPIDLEVPDISTRLRCEEPEGLPRKEVIQPQLPLRLPCYDFTLIADLTLVVPQAGLLRALPTFLM